jgi:thiol-disulfide isomerase/thioredoxin
MTANASAWSQNNVVGIVSKDAAGAFQLTLGWQPQEATRYRLVVFDAQDSRFETEAHLGAGTGNFFMGQFHVDPEKMPAERIVSVGVERLSPEGWQIVSQMSAPMAREANIAVLPFPHLHASYPFELLATDGVWLRGPDFLGSVVVIDCWASWCSPCMAKMAELCRLHAQWGGPGGLVIIGINFDLDWSKAAEAIERASLPWKQVWVTADERVRGMWYEVSTIRGLPRLFVIDRDGRLCLDSANPRELERAIASLMTPGVG